MIVVIDASAGFELLTDSQSGQEIRESIEQAELVMAPDLYVAEITNVCWKAVRRKELSIQEAVLGLRMAIAVVDIFRPASDLAVEALREASTSGHTAYDVLYLVLARREGASVISLDKGLLRLAGNMGVSLHSS